MSLKKDKKLVFQSLKTDKYLKRLNINFEKIVEKSILDHKPVEISLYKNIILHYSKNQWVVDKDPNLIELLPILHSMFSNAIIINMIRDPRDILLSKKKAKWSRSGHAWKHVFANLNQIYFSNKYGKSLFGENYVEIKYENLISETKSTLKSLCNKININFEKKMMDYVNESKKIVSKEEMSWKKETLGPILINNINKWKKELPDKEIYLIQKVCNEIMLKNNYELKKIKLSIINHFWIITGQLVIFIFSPIYKIYKTYKISKICKKLKY